MNSSWRIGSGSGWFSPDLTSSLRCVFLSGQDQHHPFQANAEPILLCRKLLKPMIFRLGGWPPSCSCLGSAPTPPTPRPMSGRGCCRRCAQFFFGCSGAGLTRLVVLAAVVSALIGLVQYFGLAPALTPWINQPQAGEAE